MVDITTYKNRSGGMIVHVTAIRHCQLVWNIGFTDEDGSFPVKLWGKTKIGFSLSPLGGLILWKFPLSPETINTGSNNG